MKIKKLIKTPWSSVVGGGFQIETDDGTYLASIIGTDKGIDKERDTEICEYLMKQFQQSLTDPLDEAVEIKRHFGNQKLIKIVGLKIIEMPECEGGGYALTGDIAERVVSLIEQSPTIESIIAKIEELSPDKHMNSIDHGNEFYRDEGRKQAISIINDIKARG